MPRPLTCFVCKEKGSKVKAVYIRSMGRYTRVTNTILCVKCGKIHHDPLFSKKIISLNLRD